MVRGLVLLRGIGVSFAAISYVVLAHDSNLAPTGRTLGVAPAIRPLLMLAVALTWYTA